MAKLKPLDKNVSIHQTLGNNPNTDNLLSADELKAKFDEAAEIIKNYLNTEVVPTTNQNEPDAVVVRIKGKTANRKASEIISAIRNGKAVVAVRDTSTMNTFVPFTYSDSDPLYVNFICLNMLNRSFWAERIFIYDDYSCEANTERFTAADKTTVDASLADIAETLNLLDTLKANKSDVEEGFNLAAQNYATKNALSEAKHTTMMIEITDDGFGGYDATLPNGQPAKSETIINHANSGGLIIARYDVPGTTQTRVYYYSNKDEDRNAIFLRTYIEDGTTKQAFIAVDYKGKVTVTFGTPIGSPAFATCDAEAAPITTVPVKWYVPKTMPRPSGNIGMMVDVFWRNGRADGIGYDISLIWGEEGGSDNETIVPTAPTSDSLTGQYSIPTEGTVRYQLIEQSGRKRWQYVSGTLISKSFSCDAAADAADKPVHGMEISYLPGMDIFVQMDRGNTANVMRLVPDSGPTLPVYGNGASATTGAISAGYILHLKNAGDHWQIINGTDGNIVAPAIPVTMTGASVSSNMVSPLPHNVGCQVYRDNMLNPAELAIGGVTVDGQPAPGDNRARSGVMPVRPGTLHFTSDPTALVPLVYYFFHADGSFLDKNSTGIVPYGAASCRMTFRKGDNADITQAELAALQNARPILSVGAVPYTPYISDLTAVTVTRNPGEQRYKPDADGVVSGMTSNSPTISLTRDNPNVTLMVTFNADTKKYIDSRDADLLRYVNDRFNAIANAEGRAF